MIIVVAALVPCLLFGMYNTGYQNFLGSGITDMNFWKIMLYGFLAILPKIIVTYAVGLGIEFIVASANIFFGGNYDAFINGPSWRD